MPVEYPGLVEEDAINSHEPEIFGICAEGIDDLPEQLMRTMPSAASENIRKTRIMNPQLFLSNTGRSRAEAPVNGADVFLLYIE